MTIAFYKVSNSLNFDRHEFDCLSDNPQKILELLHKLPEDEVRFYDADQYNWQAKSPTLADFEIDYNDEELDGDWWCIVLPISKEEKLDTSGLLSIMASLIRSEYTTATQLFDFIKEWKQKGFFKSFFPEYIHDFESVCTKVNLAETIINECVRSKEMRIALQKEFGQFDGAQFCENCGCVMWEGYSWDGATYCDEDCVFEGEHITKYQLEQYTDDEYDPEGNYYWTSWS